MKSYQVQAYEFERIVSSFSLYLVLLIVNFMYYSHILETLSWILLQIWYEHAVPNK